MKKIKLPYCKCGCQKRVMKPGNSFILGHNNKKNAYNQSVSKNRPHRFKKGNKHGKGRPQGSRNSASCAIDVTFEGEAERLTRKCIELGLAGNVACLRTAIDRICPVMKSNTVKLSGMPSITDVSSAGEAGKFLLAATLNGEITIADSIALSSVLSKVLHSEQLTIIEAELKALKEKIDI